MTPRHLEGLVPPPTLSLGPTDLVLTSVYLPTSTFPKCSPEQLYLGGRTQL